MNRTPTIPGLSAPELISNRIAEFNDWRGPTLARTRKLIREADPEVVEDWKWNIPVWKHEGVICTGETYKAAVKHTFPKGALLPDPKKLFNPKLAGGIRRSIDLAEGDVLDEAAFKALVRAAIALNTEGKAKPTAKAPPVTAKASKDKAPKAAKKASKPAKAPAKANGKKAKS
ncbi:MAG: DUF1801 domain-containing protein [Deltaproteobacteria bacterium]|nr:DUF1801 domain-containing protein [Deltaproteobacteria bacterium]